MTERVGIALLGGTGSRTRPLTLSTSKGMLPVFSKPLCFYSISILFLAGIRKLIIITTEQDLHTYMRLFGSGKEFGAEISYTVQAKPDGISQAFILAQEFLNGQSSCLILGDNIFYSNNFTNLLKDANNSQNATIFGYKVKNPQSFGVVEIDKDGKAISIEEKPQFPKSDYCVTGLYFVDSNAPELAKQLTPSKRGELEITSLLDVYMRKNMLDVKLMGRGHFWADCGNTDSLLDASNFIAAIEKRQNIMICNPHEIAFNNKWISELDLEKIIDKYGKNDYSTYLRSLISN